MRKSAALKMLFHERATALGSIAGVVAIIFLVGQQLAIFFGLLSYMSFLVDNSGADIWIKSQNTDNFNACGVFQSHGTCQVRGGIPSVIAAKGQDDRFESFAHNTPSSRESILL